MSQKLQRSQSDLLDMQTGFGGVLKGAGVTGEQLRGVSKELTTLSVAFGNAFNISDQDAFNMIQGGLVGAGRELKRYGIFVDDAAVKQYALKKGIKDNVSEMSQAQVMYLRSQILVEASNKVQEVAAKRTGSWSNAMKELGGAITDTYEELGKPHVSTAATITEGLPPSFARASFPPFRIGVHGWIGWGRKSPV